MYVQSLILEVCFHIHCWKGKVLCANWKSDFKRSAYERNLWHHKYPDPDPICVSYKCDAEAWTYAENGSKT